jgi:hypothetical protein
MYKVYLSATNMSGDGAMCAAFALPSDSKTEWMQRISEGVQMLRRKINPKNNVCLLFDDGQKAFEMSILKRLNKTIKVEDGKDADSSRDYEFALTYAIGPVKLKISLWPDPYDVYSKLVMLDDLDDDLCSALLQKVRVYYGVCTQIGLKRHIALQTNCNSRCTLPFVASLE